MTSYSDFCHSPVGRKLADELANPATLRALERAIEAGQPAVQALDEWASNSIPGLSDTEKQHVGRMVRDSLAPLGWRVGTGPRRRLRNGRLFTTGAVYVRVGKANDSEVVAPESSAAKRADEAVAILEAGRLDPALPRDTVEAFLRDRLANWGEK